MIERRVLISSIFFFIKWCLFSLSLSLSLFVVVVVVFNKKILLLAFNSNLMIIIRMNELNLLIFYLLRSNGTSTSQRFNISNSSYAAYDSTGFLFGQGADIYVKSDSNVNTGSYTYFCFSYNCQHNKSYGWNAQIYLSGNLNGWFTTEIEVYQMS